MIMIEKNGVVYLRGNRWWYSLNLLKMGITEVVKNRDGTYATGEPFRGEFIFVAEIPLEKMKTIDNCLKNYFKHLHVIYDGGTEFYRENIIELIEPYFKLLGIKYRILPKEEIQSLNYKNRLDGLTQLIQSILKPHQINRIVKKIKNKHQTRNDSKMQPKPHQQEILNTIEQFYSENNIGKLIWACGLGKSLMSVFIVQRLRFMRIAYGAPNKYLQIQIKNEILKLFPNKANILFVGGDKEKDILFANTREKIVAFLSIMHDDQPKFVICTYHSCKLLLDIAFDFKIGDEAHHLADFENEKQNGFRLFHKISSKKTLFMTATEKTIATNEKDTREKYSMNDEAVFGKYIDFKTVQWAIENEKITDYNILVLKSTEYAVDEIMNQLKIGIEHKELFLSCFMTLKSFEKYENLNHVLIYTNTTADAELCKGFIDTILSSGKFTSVVSLENIYNNALHSKNCNNTKIKDEIDKFVGMRFGIISCVYIIGEGLDLPKSNGVCIAGNMQSVIRIVQYLLRPNRLEKGNPFKIAYIIIPYIEMDDNWGSENPSYGKVRTIANQMRNVDANIEQKIKVLSLDAEKAEPKNKKRKREECEEDSCAPEFDLEENETELNHLKIRLRYSKSLGSGFTEEQDEYNYVRSINVCLNIQSKKEYHQSHKMHGHFIPLPEEYFKSKGVWNNWYDFMGTNTSKFIQSKQDWIHFCKKKNIDSLDGYFRACEVYSELPKEPDEFYVGFTNIMNEIKLKRRR